MFAVCARMDTYKQSRLLLSDTKLMIANGFGCTDLSRVRNHTSGGQRMDQESGHNRQTCAKSSPTIPRRVHITSTGAEYQPRACMKLTMSYIRPSAATSQACCFWISVKTPTHAHPSSMCRETSERNAVSLHRVVRSDYCSVPVWLCTPSGECRRCRYSNVVVPETLLIITRRTPKAHTESKTCTTQNSKTEILSMYNGNSTRSRRLPSIRDAKKTKTLIPKRHTQFFFVAEAPGRPVLYMYRGTPYRVLTN